MKRNELLNEIAEFAKENDYAFLLGAGMMCANDDETRSEVVDCIEKADTYKLLSKNEVENDASELMPEIENGCEVYEFIKSNAWQLYIAIY